MAIQPTLFRLAVLAALTVAGTAQGQSPGNTGAVAAINQAVQAGTLLYLPEPSLDQGHADGIDLQYCRELSDKVTAAPKREYSTASREIKTSQGRTVIVLERERPRDDLREEFRKKCAQ